MDGLYKALKEFGDVKINVTLAKFTTFKIGGPAALVVEVTDTQKLAALLSFLSAEGQEYFVLGGGSNVLLPDDGLQKVVIRIRTNALAIDGDMIEAEAGVLFGAVSTASVKNNLTGLEWSAGLPGTVGGAVRGNAGAMGGETKDVLERVIVWRDGEVLELRPEDCNFSYRESIFKHNNDVILKAWFRLSPGDTKKSLAVMQDIVKKRNGHYPPFPSGGSFFKNVMLKNWTGTTEGLPDAFIEQGRVPAGWLTDLCGLKGFTIGGAMVSKEHGNFLINYKNATQADVLRIVEEVKTKVYTKFNVELEEEVHIITN